MTNSHLPPRFPHKKFIFNPFELILNCAQSIRQEFNDAYDVYNPMSDYYMYAGLCDKSVDALRSKLKVKDGFKVTAYHGELYHSIKINPDHWHRQHTVCVVEHPMVGTVYVDLTIDQFYDVFLLHNKPEWYTSYGYISKLPFNYLYFDTDNIAFSDFGIWIDDNIRIKRSVKSKDRQSQEGLIQFIQFEIWGNIARLIRKISGIEKKQRIALSQIDMESYIPASWISR